VNIRNCIIGIGRVQGRFQRIFDGMDGIRAGQDYRMVQDGRDGFWGEDSKKPLFHCVNPEKSCHHVRYFYMKISYATLLTCWCSSMKQGFYVDFFMVRY